jgi:hypothetical protein
VGLCESKKKLSPRNAAGLAAKVVCLGGQMKGRQTNNSWLMDMVD